MRGLHLTPGNIGFFASFIHPDADIQERVIHLGAVTDGELLLEVPLGSIYPQATIVITVGLNKTHTNTVGKDSDLRVGISDGTNDNIQEIVDFNNYANFPSCYPVNAASEDGIKPMTGTQTSATYKLTFTPFYKYAACETAQEGGYINTGTFSTPIDTNQPLYLRVKQNDANEEYYVYYLDVKIY